MRQVQEWCVWIHSFCILFLSIFSDVTVVDTAIFCLSPEFIMFSANVYWGFLLRSCVFLVALVFLLDRNVFMAQLWLQGSSKVAVLLHCRDDTESMNSSLPPVSQKGSGECQCWHCQLDEGEILGPEDWASAEILQKVKNWMITNHSCQCLDIN